MDRAIPTPLSQAQLNECIAARKIVRGALPYNVVWPTPVDGLEANESDFIGVSLRQAVVANSHFVNCRFIDCSFRSADLADCTFERCQFYDSDSEAHCDFSYATLRNSRFEGCDLTTATCQRTRAYGIEMRRCQASGIDFSNTDFGIGGGNFTSATFVDCNLAYADFSRTILDGANFSGSRLTHSIWHDASLAGADMTGCVLDNVEARGLVLVGADLRAARFNHLDPRQIDLTGVRMNAEQGLEVLRTLGIEID